MFQLPIVRRFHRKNPNSQNPFPAIPPSFVSKGSSGILVAEPRIAANEVPAHQ
jgi:hypothetical protein